MGIRLEGSTDLLTKVHLLQFMWEYQFSGNTLCHTVSKYIMLPNYDSSTATEVDQLNSFLSADYPHIKFAFILKIDFTLGSYFKLKDSLPLCIRSKVIYKYL